MRRMRGSRVSSHVGASESTSDAGAGAAAKDMAWERLRVRTTSRPVCRGWPCRSGSAPMRTRRCSCAVGPSATRILRCESWREGWKGRTARNAGTGRCGSCGTNSRYVECCPPRQPSPPTHRQNIHSIGACGAIYSPQFIAAGGPHERCYEEDLDSSCRQKKLAFHPPSAYGGATIGFGSARLWLKDGCAFIQTKRRTSSPDPEQRTATFDSSSLVSRERLGPQFRSTTEPRQADSPSLVLPLRSALAADRSTPAARYRNLRKARIHCRSSSATTTSIKLFAF